MSYNEARKFLKDPLTLERFARWFTGSQAILRGQVRLEDGPGADPQGYVEFYWQQNEVDGFSRIIVPDEKMLKHIIEMSADLLEGV